MECGRYGKRERGVKIRKKIRIRRGPKGKQGKGGK